MMPFTLIGVAIAASTWLFGGVAFAAVTAILRLLGAPGELTLLPASDPGAESQILQLFGVMLLACGGCTVSLRLVAELLGLAGASQFTTRLKGIEKLGAGAGAGGFVAVVVTGHAQSLLNEVFLYEYGVGGVMAALEMAGYAAVSVLLGGLTSLTFGGAGRHRVLLGWGRLGHGWINKLGLGLIVLALVGAMLGFEDSNTIVAAAVIGILRVGIVPHFLAGGRP